MLGNVTRPDGKTVTFKYDALGRRIEKTFNGRVHRYLWDGDVILHEWEYDETERPQPIVAENGDVSFDRPEPTDNLVTWVYDTDGYVPTAKLVGGKRYGIVSDYIGRPVQAYDEHGTPVWQADYDIYGNLLNQKGDRMFVPFRQLGQYEDEETGLYYNRFRYYEPNTGGYISQDPIGLEGNNSTLYAYVYDHNKEVDIFGLNGTPQLPNETILSGGNTKIVHYYNNLTEHAEPIHFHIEENGNSIGKIKADGTLISGRTNRTSQNMVKQSKNKLRKAEKKIANYLRKVRKAVAGKPFKYGNRGCKS